MSTSDRPSTDRICPVCRRSRGFHAFDVFDSVAMQQYCWRLLTGAEAGDPVAVRAALDCFHRGYDRLFECEVGWYSHDPENGTRWHRTAEEAESASHEDMAYQQDCAETEGWHEDMAALQWGRLVPHARAVKVNSTPPDDEHPDGTEEWALRPCRSTPGGRGPDPSCAGYVAGQPVGRCAGDGHHTCPSCTSFDVTRGQA